MKCGVRLLWMGGLGVFLAGCQANSETTHPVAGESLDRPTNIVVKTEAEWKEQLSSEQYRVLRKAGTERPFGPAYDQFKRQGVGTYVCAGCGAELFSSNEKFDSQCGWPSFYDPANARNVITKDDVSMGMVRTEVLCAVCDGHLGHVFKGEGFDTPTDLRYCINGVALMFKPGSASGDATDPER